MQGAMSKTENVVVETEYNDTEDGKLYRVTRNRKRCTCGLHGHWAVVSTLLAVERIKYTKSNNLSTVKNTKHSRVSAIDCLVIHGWQKVIGSGI